ncbi:MAG: hypothetical protein QMD92_01840 [bacterium]|nr:hypothetical protein [bacterium]
MNNWIIENHFDTLDWLAHSGIRREDGGYFSEYDPKKKRFSCWGEGQSCTLSTAGAILAFLCYQKYIDKAIVSGEHLLSLIIEHSHKYHGLIPSGMNSKTSRCYASAIACQALLKLFEFTKDKKYYEACLVISDAIIENMIRKDGSIRREIVIRPGFNFRYFLNLLKPVFLWDLESFLIFKELYNYTKKQKYLHAYKKIIYWAHRNINNDATIYFGKINIPFILYLSTEKSWSETKANFKGWFTRFHPTALTALLKTYLDFKRIKEANKLAMWLKNHIGPNGLLFQWYYTDEEHSEEEDVMPTAQFGLILMENKDKFSKELEPYLDIIYKGLLTAKIKDKEKNIYASYKGLPFDKRRGHKTFTWDTAYALLFFYEYHKRRKLEVER